MEEGRKIAESKPINIKLIAKILRKASERETLIEGVLVRYECPLDESKKCKTTGRCAIGELLFRAGMKDEKLARGGIDEGTPNTKASRLLSKVYGLHHSLVDDIEHINDNTEPEFRYENVMAFIEFAEAMRQQGLRPSQVDYEYGFFGAKWDGQKYVPRDVDEASV